MARHLHRSRTRAQGRALAAVTVGAVAVGAAVGVVRLRSDAQAVPPAPPLVEQASGLDPELQRRFDVAQQRAAADGVTLTLTSGWRSAAEQQAIVDDAVRRYGSEADARRWVLPPGSSAHVQGTAIDVGPTEGALWLGEHAFELGLCRTYANEMWHFELLPEGADRCPDLLPDSSSGW